MGISNIKDLLNDDLVGFLESDNIENFPTLNVSEEDSFECVDDSEFRKPNFVPKKIVFFDSVVRLDFVVATKFSILGFVTFALGSVFSEYEKPIDIGKSIKFEVVRKLIGFRDILKEDFSQDRFELVGSGFTLNYEVYAIDFNINKVNELWDEIVLKKLLPELENKFISEILDEFDSETILIKDGNIYDFSPSDKVFGHVKNFSVPKVLFDDKNIKSSFRSSIYRNKSKENVYSCFVDLGRDRNYRLLGRGIFDYLRIDVVCDYFRELSNDIVDKFNFVSDYIFRSTSMFSSSNRFPQNTPMIESIESFLRSVSGDRRIIMNMLRSISY